MTHDNLRELMLLYVTNGLTPDERADIEARLDQHDPTALAALAEAEATVSHISLDLPPVTPSADMWSKLEAQLSAPVQADSRATPLPAEPRRSPWLTGLAAAALIAITAGITNWISTTEKSSTDDIIAMRDRLEQTRDELVNTQEALNKRKRADEERQRELVQQREQLAARDGMLAEKDQLIAAQKEDLESQRNDLLAQQQQTRTQRDQLQDQRGQLNSKDARITEQDLALQKANRTIEDQQKRIDELERKLRDLEQQQIPQQYVEDPQRIPGTMLAALAGNDNMPNATARAEWNSTNFRLSLAGESFDQLPPGKTYQLWFVSDKEETISLGIFDVEQDGTVSFDTTFGRMQNNVAAVAVSVEDSGGATDAPKGAVVMVGVAAKADG